MEQDKLIQIILKNIDEEQLLKDLAKEFIKDDFLKIVAPMAIKAIVELLQKLERGK